MAEITLKATAAAMSMILGVAIALATFITYGTAAVRGALADVRGPTACSFVNQTWTAGSAVCANSPADSKCLRIIVSYSLDGAARLTALLHPTFFSRAIANATYCKKVYCDSSESLQLQLTGYSESDIPSEFDDGNLTLDCLIDQTQPGHAFLLSHRHNRLSAAMMTFTRLEAIFLLLAPSLTLVAIAASLAVCCRRRLDTAEVATKDEPNTYVKIGEKYYAKASFKAKIAMVTTMSAASRKAAAASRKAAAASREAAAESREAAAASREAAAAGRSEDNAEEVPDPVALPPPTHSDYPR